MIIEVNVKLIIFSVQLVERETYSVHVHVAALYNDHMFITCLSHVLTSL